MAGITIPLMVDGLSGILSASRAVETLGRSVVQNVSDQKAAIASATRVVDGYAEAAAKATAKLNALQNREENRKPGDARITLKPQYESHLRMQQDLKKIKTEWDSFASSQEKAMRQLTRDLTRDSQAREEQISAIRLAIRARDADTKSIEKQTAEVIDATAALKNYDKALDAAATGKKQDLADIRQPVLAEAERRTRQRRVLQTAENIARPEVQAIEQQDVLNKGSRAVVTLGATLTSQMAKLQEEARHIDQIVANTIQQMRNKAAIATKLREQLPPELAKPDTTKEKEQKEVVDHITAALNRQREAVELLRNAEHAQLTIAQIRAKSDLDAATAKDRYVASLREERNQAALMLSQDTARVERMKIYAKSVVDAATHSARRVASLKAEKRAVDDLYRPEVQAMEVAKIKGKMAMDAATASARYTARLRDEYRQVVQMTSSAGIRLAILKVQAKADVDAATHSAKRAAAMRAEERAIQDLLDPAQQKLAVDKLAAQAQMQAETFDQRNNNTLAEEERRLRASMEARSLMLSGLREEARLKNELAAAEGKQAAREADPAAGARLAVLREQAHLENQLAVAQAKKSGVLRPLVAQLEQYRKQTDAAGVSTKTFSLRVHLAAQGAAAMRSAMYGMGASFGIFTSATLLVASSVYAVTSAFRQGARAAIEYESALSALGAYSSNAKFGTAEYAEDLRKLNEQVLTLANSTKYTTGEVAEGAKQLALAGLKYEETIKALPATLRLATVGALDFGRAADIATNIMMGFRKSVNELPAIVDVISKAATDSNTDVEQLGTAMSYAAPLAESFGVSLEYTAAAMMVLANSGIKASRAGTGMRRVFLSLFTPTEKIQTEVAKFGITLSSLGEIEGLDAIDGLAVDLGNAGKGAAQAQKMLEQFYIATDGGTKNLQLIRDAVGVYATPAMIQLVKSVGMAKGSIQQLSAELEKAAGTSEDQAKKMLDNLKAVGQQLQASGSALSARLYEEAGKSFRNAAERLLAWTRAVAASSSNFKVFYAAVEKSVILLLKLIGALVAVKLAIMGFNVAMWAAIQVWGVLVALWAGAPAVVAKVIAAFVALRAALSGVTLAAAATALVRLPVVLGALGIAAVGAAGGWAAFSAALLPIAAVLTAIGIGLKYVYDNLFNVPDVIESVSKAYTQLTSDITSSVDAMGKQYEMEALTGEIRTLYEEKLKLDEAMRSSQDRASAEFKKLETRFGEVTAAILKATEAQKAFAKSYLPNQIRAISDEIAKTNAEIKANQALQVTRRFGFMSEEDLAAAKIMRQELAGTNALLETRNSISAKFLGVLQAQLAAYNETDPAKQLAAFAGIETTIKAISGEFTSIRDSLAGSKNPLDAKKADLYTEALGRLLDVLTRIAAETSRVSALVPASSEDIDKYVADIKRGYTERLKLMVGTELQQKKAAVDAANTRAVAASASAATIIKAYDDVSASLKQMQEGDDIYNETWAKKQSLAAKMAEALKEQGDATEQLLEANKAHQSELDSTAKAQDKVTKTAYDWHMANVQLKKDLEDLRRSMMDLTEQTLARGTQFFSDITAGAGIAAKAFRQVTLSGEEMSQSVVQSVEAAQTARAGGGAGQSVSGPYSALFNRYGAESGVDPRLLQLQVGAESSGNPNAVSPTGVRGLAQFTTRTGRQYGITDWYNPEQQVRAQAAYMRDLLRQRNGSVPEALSMYQSGSPTPRTEETRRYVSRITQQYQGGGGSLTQQNSALVDESKRVTFLTADVDELAEARKKSWEASREEFSIRKHIAGLREEEIKSQIGLRNAYQEVHYWNEELAAGRVTEVSQREAMKAATDVYTATLQFNSQARENQLKWEEYGIRTDKLKELQVVREKEELDALGEKYGQGQKEVKDFTYAKLELDLAYQKNAISSGEYQLALSEELTKVAQAKGEYATFFDSLRYDSEDFAKIGVQAFTDFRDAMAEAFVSGEFNFKKMLETLRDAAARFAADKVMEGLFAPSTKTSSGGLLSGLLGSLLPSIFGGKGGGAAAAGANIPTGRLMVNVPGAGLTANAHGGTFSAALPHGVYTQPTLFPMAGSGMRAFASGTGLLGEAGPEAVLPLVRGSGGDLGVKAVSESPIVNVVVNTRPGETANVSQQGNTLTIDIVEQALASRISKGGSSLPRAMEQAYGTRRKG